MTKVIGDEFYRKDPIFDGTKKSALKLIRKVFPKLHKYSAKEISNTSVGGLWKDDEKDYRIWIIVPSITALQTMQLAYYFQTEPNNIVLTPDFGISPNCNECWWNIEILLPNSGEWQWKPQ